MMTELFGDLLHKDDQLTDGQMICRAVVAFLLTIALVRLAGRRSFGMRSPFDTVISLLLGATLSRGIVGASSFTGVLGASLALVILHRLLAYLCVQSPLLSRLVSGNDKVLFENGHFIRSHMRAMLVSEQDLREAVRQVGQKDSIDDVKAILIERNGQISVVKKEKY
ncbi:DUF421 domain-containing protein [Spirosoma aerolatum]|uniref:DUF421 domain-containing protein n=1 Tax=Spirosoma aerolatum TaxID=1211326 RepID=UPI001FEBF427|nr:YetF domain-containing protein [Spirosoma aerolatum]